MNNWNDLLTLILIVFAIYLILSLCIFLILKQLKKRRINDYYFTLIRKVRLFYKPSGWLIILGGFISLDPTTHGLLALILGAFFFNPYAELYLWAVYQSQSYGSSRHAGSSW